jgi:Family of unknown function (DUF5309)
MAQGAGSTYNLTNGLMLDIEPMINLLSPYDVPLTGGYGADGRTAIAQGTCFEKQVQWLDEVLISPRTTSTATYTSAATTVVVADADVFVAGDVLLTTNNEYVRVTAVDSAGTSLTVTRSYASSTAAAITSGTSLVGVGAVLVEGSDPGTIRNVDRTTVTNNTQVFGPYAVGVTGSEQVIRKYGLNGTTEFEHQVANRLKEAAIGIEQAVLYGIKQDGSASVGRSMNGLISFVTTNVDSTTTTITEATLLAQMQAAYDLGGLPDRLVVGSKTKRVISAFASGLTLNSARVDNGRGTIVDYFDSDFGRVSVILDRWCRTQDAFGFNRDQVELSTLRPLQFEPLAKTGDSIKGQIVGEKTLKVRRQKHGFRFSALT